MPWREFVVLPIPLGRNRLLERGFNQSELVARIFSSHFNIPIETENLIRVKNTKAQSQVRGLDERIKNVAGAFEVKNMEALEGKDIILIDDVTTSGATLREAARVLKNCGVKKIVAMVAARA